MRRLACTAAAVGAFGFGIAPAWAEVASDQTLASALEVVPGATCLDRERLEEAVEAWLGRTRVAGDVHVAVRGDDRDPGSVAFAITRAGQTRDRRFYRLPSSCDEATAVVGLAIAMAIDAGAVASTVGPLEPEAPPRRSIVAQVEGGFDVLADASVGPAVGVELGVSDWLSLRLDLMAQFTWGASIEQTSGTFDAQVFAAAPAACAGGPVTGTFRLELCSGAAFGVVLAQGRGFAVTHSASGPWIVGEAGVRAGVVAGIPWAIDVGAVFPLHVPSFRAQTGAGTDQVSDHFRDPNPVGLLVGVGPAFTF